MFAQGSLDWKREVPLRDGADKVIAFNVLGAYKKAYFNASREYGEKMGRLGEGAYGVLLAGYINDALTYVSSPDGKFGYGGKCFPMDVNAFAKMT